MKDKRFLIMCGLGLMWLLILIDLLTGEMKINPRIEAVIAFLCIGWFAYWTISAIRENRLPHPNDPTPQPTDATTKKSTEQ